MIRVLNIMAALLLALLPVLEPCRLGTMFTPAETGHDAPVCASCCGHHHETPQTPEPAPSHVECDHLAQAVGLTAAVLVSVELAPHPAVLYVHALRAWHVCPTEAEAWQKPPPIGVALVGTSNLRI